jgi:hypothetical protein
LNIVRYKNTGQGESEDRELYIQALKAMLKIRGSRVRLLQLMQFLDFVQDTCPWFPEEGIVNLETWNKVGDRLRVLYMTERLEDMSIFTFGLCSMIKDCLGPSPSPKERFSSSVFEPRCGTHPL